MIGKVAFVLLVAMSAAACMTFPKKDDFEKSTILKKLLPDSKVGEMNEKEAPMLDLDIGKFNQDAVKLQLYNDNDETVEQTAYLLVKTLRHRDKRYVGYLSLCHFKICNMGKRRSTRYSQIRPNRNNNGKK